MSRTRALHRAPTDPYHDPRWPPIRRYVLERDGHTCQMRGPGCTTIATQVNHKTSWQAGTEYWFDLTNLEAACQHCNACNFKAPYRSTAPPSRNW